MHFIKTSNQAKNTKLKKAIHIISFDIPFPADYGGVIDVFYRIKYLHEAGYSVFLHAFEYSRKPTVELNRYCKSVSYYKRKTGIRSFFSFLPYIVYSRRSDYLLQNLLASDCPIIFEGLHTCYYLDHPSLKGRTKIVRAHNIEHVYYKNLARTTHNPAKKFFFFTESIKLKYFEKILRKASIILPISFTETEYFSVNYGNTEWISAFHGNVNVSSSPGKGNFILLHGNLSISENEQAILHALRNILRFVDFKIIIAGKNPSRRFADKIKKHPGTILIESPAEDDLKRLIANAHINLITAIHPSGFKLKLINALYLGRFVVANPAVVNGTELEKLVFTGKGDEELVAQIKELLNQEFEISMIEKRKAELEKHSDKSNIIHLTGIIESKN